MLGLQAVHVRIFYCSYFSKPKGCTCTYCVYFSKLRGCYLSICVLSIFSKPWAVHAGVCFGVWTLGVWGELACLGRVGMP